MKKTAHIILSALLFVWSIYPGVTLVRRAPAAAGGGGSVTYDSVTNGSCVTGGCGAGGDTLTFSSHSITASADAAALVAACVSGPGATTQPEVSTVTVGGTGATVVTNLSHVPAASDYYCAWYYLANPGSGVKSVVITLASALPSNSKISGAIWTASGVNQSGVVVSGAAGSNGGSGTSATATLGTTVSGDLPVYVVCSGTSNTSTATGTERFDTDDSAAACNSFSGATTTGGTTSIAWTVASDSWILSGTAFDAN